MLPTRAERPVRIRVQADFGGIADLHVWEIVLVNVAENPDGRKVGDGEQVGRIVECLDAAGGIHVLFGDDARAGATMSTMVEG